MKASISVFFKISKKKKRKKRKNGGQVLRALV